jgi:hypothetical protein
VEAPETDSGSAGLTGKRPRGRDYSKAERKKGASSSSLEYLSRLQEITEKQIQRSIEKGKKRKEQWRRQGHTEEEIGIGSSKVKHSTKGTQTWRTRIGKQTFADAAVDKRRRCWSRSLDNDEGTEKKLQQFIFSFE